MRTQKPASPFAKFFVGRIFPWPFILAGVYTVFFGTRNVFRASESANWPTAQGIIQGSSVEYHSSNKGGTYHAHVWYVYHLNGTAFSGDRVLYGDFGSSDPSHAQEIVNRYPVGKSVIVYYMPANTEECVLEPGIKPQTWFLPGFGMVFFSVGAVMAVFLPRLTR